MVTHSHMKCPPTGALEKPIIIRGNPPKRWCPPPKTRWAAAFNLGRQNPAWWDELKQEWVGGWMLVAQIKEGGWKERTHRIKLDRDSIERWLRKYHLHEMWQIKVTTAEHYVKQCYLRYLFTMNDEELELELKRRHEVYERIQQRGREKKVERELAARLAAEAEERERLGRAQRTAERRARAERAREAQAIRDAQRGTG